MHFLRPIRPKQIEVMDTGGEGRQQARPPQAMLLNGQTFPAATLPTYPLPGPADIVQSIEDGGKHSESHQAILSSANPPYAHPYFWPQQHVLRDDRHIASFRNMADYQGPVQEAATFQPLLQQQHQYHANPPLASSRPLRHAQSLDTMSRALQPSLLPDTAIVARLALRSTQVHTELVVRLERHLRTSQDEVAELHRQLTHAKQELALAKGDSDSQAARYHRDWMTKSQHESKVRDIHQQRKSEIRTLRAERDRLRQEVNAHSVDMAQKNAYVAVLEKRLGEQAEKLRARSRMISELEKRDGDIDHHLQCVWGDQARLPG